MFNKSANDIIEIFTKEDTDYIDSIKNKLKKYCKKDKNVKKIVELIFNEYKEHTFNWYMAEEMKNILRVLNIEEDFEKQENYEIRMYGKKSILGNILNFIEEYIHLPTTDDYMPCKGLSLTTVYTKLGDAELLIRSYQFMNEEHMIDYGYTNKSYTIIKALKEIAEIKMDQYQEELRHEEQLKHGEDD